MIDRGHGLPLTVQGRMLGLSRSSLYYKAVPVSERDLELMRLIDEIHLKYPFYGARRIRDELEARNHKVGRLHVGTLMEKMDITYIPMPGGFCYLVAIMDWASRKVLAWRLSNTLDASFYVDALEEALARFGAPEIFNTDQGSQFTSEAFTGYAQLAGR
jgi:putative transposase